MTVDGDFGSDPGQPDRAAVLETALDQTRLLIAYLDTELRFVRVNRAYAAADHKEPSFFVGKGHFDLYPNPDNERIFREVLTRGVAHAVRAKPFEYAHAPDRGVTHWDWSVAPIRSGGVITGLVLELLDVSESIRMLEELRASDSVFRTLFEESPDGIALVDSDARVTRQSNPAAARLLGLTPGSESVAQLDAFAARLLELGEGRHTTRVDVPGEDARHVAVSTRSVEVQGKPMLLAMLEDVTELTRANERLRRSLEEKEVLLREVHHRVKNNLQVISSLLYLQRGKVDDPAAQRAFDESRNRILAMATIHEHLYASGDFTQVDLAKYVGGLLRSVAATYSTDQAGIDLVVDVTHVLLAVDVAIPCGLVLNELVSNAIEHAFPAGHGGRVTIFGRSTARGGVLLAVEDDGVGMPDPVRPDLGFRMVESLARELGARLGIRRGGGTRVTLELAARSSALDCP